VAPFPRKTLEFGPKPPSRGLGRGFGARGPLIAPFGRRYPVAAAAVRAGSNREPWRKRPAASMREEGRMVPAGDDGEVAHRARRGGGVGLPVENRVFSSSFLLVL
jgi:hypothetical protein